MYTERQTQIITHFRAVYAEFGRNAEQYPILVWTDNGDGGLGFIAPQEVEELIEQGCKFFAAIPPKVRNMWTSTSYYINRSILEFTPPAPPAPRFKSLKPLARRILTRALIGKMVGKFDHWHYQALESYDECKVERQASAFYGGMSDWSNPGYYEDLEYPVHPLKRRKRVHKRIPPLTPEELAARRQWLEDLPF